MNMNTRNMNTVGKSGGIRTMMANLRTSSVRGGVFQSGAKDLTGSDVCYTNMHGIMAPIPLR